MKSLRVEVNGVDLEVLELGEGPKAALLVHGFPDDAGSMRDPMEKLAAEGYRCWAPYLRGYGRSGGAAQGDFRMATLAGDIVALAGRLSGQPVLLIGHDWGAVIAYIAAAAAPERFARMVTMAVPPPATFLIGARRHPRQLLRSWYMFFFQLRGVAEWWVRRRNFAFIEQLWRAWSPGWNYTPERINEVKASLAPPGNLTAALGYYRQNLAARGPEQPPVTVPALIIAGARDGCIGPEVFEGSEKAYSAPVELQIVRGAGHFMHLEQPEEIWMRIRAFIRS